ncbi:MAG: hypothetical protein OHK005_02000 [Candidatus Methylacidiphilales bacterium]
MVLMEDLWRHVNELAASVLPAPWPGVKSGVVAGVAFLMLVLGLTRLHAFGGAGLVSPVLGAFAAVVGLILMLLGDIYGVAALEHLGINASGVARARWVLPWAVGLLVVVPVTRWAFRANYWTSAGAWLIATALAGTVLWVARTVLVRG